MSERDERFLDGLYVEHEHGKFDPRIELYCDKLIVFRRGKSALDEFYSLTFVRR